MHFTVHPRVCGEHLSNITQQIKKRGSSPRVRGTPRTRTTYDACRRFIPACAGNTRNSSRSASCSSVHPRVCGEHVKIQCDVFIRIGSSPRVRGTLDCTHHQFFRWRFIPACAGNTPCIDTTKKILAVHPRVCGEHLTVRTTNFSDGGSSPRVRGTLHVSTRRKRFWRFIPACAGNTVSD